MSDATDHLDWLSAQLADAETAWSVGSFHRRIHARRRRGHKLSTHGRLDFGRHCTRRLADRGARQDAPGRLGIADDAKLEPPRRLVPAGRHLRDGPAHGPHRNRAGCGRAARARPLGGSIRSRAWNVAGQRLHSHRRCGRHRGAEKLDRPIAVRARQRRDGRDLGGQSASRVREPSRTRRSLSANTWRTAKAPRARTPMCCPGCCATSAPTRQRNLFRQALCRAHTSIRRIRRATRWVFASRFGRIATRHSRNCSRGSAR
jgi:hypothetical protein